jgi:hypothetical protein
LFIHHFAPILSSFYFKIITKDRLSRKKIVQV